MRNKKKNEIKHYIGIFSWLLEILCFDFIQFSSVKLLGICDFNRESMRARDVIQNLELLVGMQKIK